MKYVHTAPNFKNADCRVYVRIYIIKRSRDLFNGVQCSRDLDLMKRVDKKALLLCGEGGGKGFLACPRYEVLPLMQ